MATGSNKPKSKLALDVALFYLLLQAAVLGKGVSGQEIKVSSAKVTLPLIAGARRAQEDLVEARYLVSFWWLQGFSLSNKLQSYFEPPSLLISCGNNAQAVLLEDENIDWGACESISTSTLQCTESRFVHLVNDGDLYTSRTVACVGSSPEDVLFISATIPESTVSLPTGVTGFTRQVKAESICDSPRQADAAADLRENSLYLPQTLPISVDFTCSSPSIYGSNEFAYRLSNSLGDCRYTSSCSNFPDAYLDLPLCASLVLPAITASVDATPPDFFVGGGIGCVFDHVPNPVPTIAAAQTTQKADYLMELIYVTGGCALPPDSAVQITCFGNGVLSTGDDLSDCTRVNDGGAIVCLLSDLTDGVGLQSLEASLSCSGNTLEDLAIAALWNPGTGGLDCSTGTISSLLSQQQLNLYQKCTSKTTAFGPFADLAAMSCFPLSSSFSSSVSVTSVDESGGTDILQIYFYESCRFLNVGSGCAPNCQEMKLSRLSAGIKAEHIDLDCIYAGDGGNGRRDIDGGGGAGGTGGGAASGGTSQLVGVCLFLDLSLLVLYLDS